MSPAQRLYLTGIRSFTVLAFLACVTTPLTQAQVSIAPTAVFLQEQSPFSNVIISNGSDTPQEISISFEFGYSITDDRGNLSMHYDTTGHESSFVGHLNAFPRNFVLEPGQRQTVRLGARGYGDKEDGTYWSRVRVLASPLSPPVEASAGEGVAARININFEQVIPAFFRKGDVTTGVEIRDISFETEEDQSFFLLDMERTGNSPFVGSLVTRVTDGNGQELIEQTASISTYFETLRRVNVNLSELPPGDYEARFTIQSQRRDISSSDLIEIEPVHQNKTFTIE